MAPSCGYSILYPCPAGVPRPRGPKGPLSKPHIKAIAGPHTRSSASRAGWHAIVGPPGLLQCPSWTGTQSRSLAGSLQAASLRGHTYVPYAPLGLAVEANPSSQPVTGTAHGRIWARMAHMLVIRLGPHAQSSRSWPAGQDHAGFSGLLEPREQTEQSSPLGADNLPDGRDPRELGKRCLPISQSDRHPYRQILLAVGSTSS